MGEGVRSYRKLSPPKIELKKHSKAYEDQEALWHEIHELEGQKEQLKANIAFIDARVATIREKIEALVKKEKTKRNTWYLNPRAQYRDLMSDD